ncbi:MAG: DedA family protein [Gemmatimonadaceae bacterium]
MQGILDWLAALPPGGLYLALGFAAAIENVFPPLPSDVVVAFGSFVAARGRGSAVGAFLSTWVGSLTGAMAMYWAGRRYGAELLARRLLRGQGDAARERLDRLFRRYGIGAIVVSRFLPAVRAVVPPFAGALRIPPVRALLAMAFPSAVWYGAITWLAFRAGAADWQELLAQMKTGQRWVGLGAAVVVAVALTVFLVARRRRR